MRRRAGLCVVLAAAGLAAGAGAPATASAVQVLGVSSYDFSFLLSRPKLERGLALIELVNRGEDDHNLVFKRVDGTQRPVDFGTVIPGAISVRTTRLRPGEYRLVCTLEGHRQIGMLSTLKVRGG